MARKAKTVWKVFFADQEFVYFTRYHAEQFARALTLNRTPCVIEGPIMVDPAVVGKVLA